ncbi:hypothetical protein [Corynebacterium sp. A21]|uniref:hypothetical protein n=1 Tax=Corynebacterium sp. A21 TaxID=3457318 RepID=UPI003FD5F056
MADPYSPSSTTQRSRGRGRGVIIGLLLLIVAVVAVLVGRGGIPNPFASGEENHRFVGGTTEIRAIIGSEKRDFFEDPAVQEVLATHGYSVKIDTAGSRKIATGANLDEYDLAFPSSGPAAQKIAEQVASSVSYIPFHSPMAIASFDTILMVLEKEGVATLDGNAWRLDMAGLAELGLESTRWRDIAGDQFPSPRTVQVATTDIRTSNSAAMYLSLMSWILNENKVVSTDQEVTQVVDLATPLFVGQGYAESTSAGPFFDYLSQGIGSKPMVMVYESQYLGEVAADESRITADMALAYPSPTILSAHTALGLSEAGTEVARLLTEDPELQELAGQHGYRPHEQRYFDEVRELLPAGEVAPPNLIDSVDPPSYDRLEDLINGVAAGYGSPPPPAGTHEE